MFMYLSLLFSLDISFKSALLQLQAWALWVCYTKGLLLWNSFHPLKEVLRDRGSLERKWFALLRLSCVLICCPFTTRPQLGGKEGRLCDAWLWSVAVLSLAASNHSDPLL